MTGSSKNTKRTMIGIAAAAGLAIVGANVDANPTAIGLAAAVMGVGDDPAAPPSIQLTGVVRDFRADHPDFQRQPRKANGSGSFGHYIGIPASEIGDDGKPAFGSKGRKVLSQWYDGSSRKVLPGLEDTGYIDSKTGDITGSAEAQGDAVESAATFDQWFRDIDGVNAGRALSIKLMRNDATGSYVFDDTQDALYQQRGGFFPINGELYGDYQNDTNFHFTYEINTEFNFEVGSGQTFRFIGDDDVWVYIDGKLVIDLGGVHSKIDQIVELDRLNWLEDGEVYTLQFFFAERHTTQSNFRIETNMLLRTVKLPATTALHD